MALTQKQVEALSDAFAHSGQGKKGLQKAHSRWFADDFSGCSYGHSNRTISSLVNRGLMKLWVTNTVAHITDLGTVLLDEFKERA